MKRVTRKAANKAGRRYFFTGRECHRGHISKRFVSNGRCVECLREGPRYQAMVRRRNRRYQAEHAHRLLVAEYGSETRYIQIRRRNRRLQKQQQKEARLQHLADLAKDPYSTIWRCSRCGEVDTLGEPWCLGCDDDPHPPVYRYPEAKEEYIAHITKGFQQRNINSLPPPPY